nr:immunoglobulin heavy chain junction region [Macaca mulatta]MOW75371.1 immunoglobulin heavy chain junction region [Macaca mulatta]MOW75377.1 immunoglobulin heavy chain junction region [Macaca mulatta]MOW75741.1 immunoglobulin heavy chain junction region [Macaca mulatta]MOW75773.1 immunoglobulin heavy chain junction region [Macaca mulatta]
CARGVSGIWGYYGLDSW